MNKKGQGISMTYIIIAALALVVLTVMILFFTGALDKLFTQQKGVIEGATEQQQNIWRSKCKLYCSLGQKESFCDAAFEGPKDEDGEITKVYTCNTDMGGKPDGYTDAELLSLDVECDSFEKCI